jgi:hypothetical protein
MVLSGLTRLRRARGHGGTARVHTLRSNGLLFGALAVLAAAVTQCTGGPLTLRRVDLKVLVLESAPNYGMPAMVESLNRQGVPYQLINTAAAGRPVIDTAFLSSTTGTNPVVERANFQAVFAESQALPGLTEAERTALAAFEAKFGVRQVDAYAFAGPSAGLDLLGAGGGAIDGTTASVTAAGLTGPFKYLAGPVPMGVNTYLSAGTPAATLPAGASFTNLATVPFGGTNATLAGIYKHDGREELVSMAAHFALSTQARVLTRGIVDWATKGVHLGHDRTYLTVHVDDLFGADSRWSTTANCTPGEADCPAGAVAGPDIRMTAADLQATVAWQSANGFKFDWPFNGFGSVEYVDEHGGSDPLLAAAKANVAQFYWLNHTYQHLYLGCVQDVTVIPWRCTTNASGQVQYVSQATIQAEIAQNVAFAQANGLPIDPSELLTGEHSGLYITPQQPADNPNLVPAFNANGIKVTGSDASRQLDSRLVGSTRTVPRYPMANFFNVGTKAEMIDEFNYIHASAADGGGGFCGTGTVTGDCLPAVNTTTGYDDSIIPLDTDITLRHMLANDPRPHYVHQSNLAEERILLPLMNSILGRYRSMYNATAPVVHVTETQAADLLTQQAAWGTGRNQVEAYTLGNELYVNKGAYTGAVPITAPNGTKVDTSTGPVFGTAYAGELSAWVSLPATGSYRLILVTAP